ncbi:FkbM family methyltransferase [Hyphomonadaceae bacterium ML37]|nr:FkbM family methyltransferase [Hyphomonadaceae bacterium ML37]
MNELLSALKISSFTTMLKGYRDAKIEIGSVIDGGAGAGSTARSMLRAYPELCRCYAFEPFPGNHRFFEGADERILLKKQALGNKSQTAKFEVPSVVPEASEWGEQGMAGYSSVGSLSIRNRPGSQTIEVDCVRAEDVVTPGEKIGFIKLDLQGGEVDAIEGMSALLGDVEFMWVEYLGNPDLYDTMSELGFMLFDTKYVFRGEPTPEALEIFDLAFTKHASTGQLR